MVHLLVQLILVRVFLPDGTRKRISGSAPKHRNTKVAADQARKLVAGVAGMTPLQVTTAVGRLRSTYDQFLANTAMETERAQESQGFMALQARWDKAGIQSLQELFEIDRQAEVAQAGQIKGQIVATDQDSWESLARRAYGDGTRADEIRELNGVEAGQQPQAGVGYLVPV